MCNVSVFELRAKEKKRKREKNKRLRRGLVYSFNLLYSLSLSYGIWYFNEYFVLMIKNLSNFTQLFLL